MSSATTTTNKKINVLIYAGPGSSPGSVHHATWSLRRLLGPTYAVLTVTETQILNEPWPASCALLVMPGGADLGYCRVLHGLGNRRIQQYVQGGGKYLGLCAGGYYGCRRCEFEVGKLGMEVAGHRELGFFPGICRGLAFDGFQYNSEIGARAAEVRVKRDGWVGGMEAPENVKVYYNGGGVFVDAEKFADRGVEVLASYTETEDLAVQSGEGVAAAVVYCTVGEGAAILTGPHPEFSGLNLSSTEPTGHADYAAVVATLVANEQPRVAFMKACLARLGLHLIPETQAVPSLSQLHLSSIREGGVAELKDAWDAAGIVMKDDNGRECIRGENDTFVIVKSPSADAKEWDMDDVKAALPSTKSAKESPQNTDKIIDYNALPKDLVLHPTSLPSPSETPLFNHQTFFSALHSTASSTHSTPSSTATPPPIFGSPLLYGQTVTSTSTLLDKNPTFLSHLPTGLTATATQQLAGRGRGSNVWVSPPGSLMFSTVIRHGLSLSTEKAPVVFVQYLAAMAVVAGIKGYERNDGKEYRDLPIRLKWPNDIYALDPTTSTSDDDNKGKLNPSSYVKIGGILVNSSYSGGDYTLVVGIGLNVSNTAGPTTSLHQIAEKHLASPYSTSTSSTKPTSSNPYFHLEPLLASILTNFQSLYTHFCQLGWDRELQRQYYDLWLHSGQVVTLETEGGARARIKGITEDWGLLVADELERDARTGGEKVTGKTFALQSDSNSFDFFKGLLKRKI